MIRAALALATVLVLADGGRGRPAAKVSFLDGEATRSAGGCSEKLAEGTGLEEGDEIETRRQTRLELTLRDGSVIRLGPATRMRLDTAAFGRPPEERRVFVRLLLGTLWAKVARALGGEARFEVRTENAVAGVRGTTFRVDASHDRSVVVRVYSGTVAVAGGGLPRPEHGDGGPRHEVKGPSEVTREQWERVVTTMMEVRVSADGAAEEPRGFRLAPGDDWERWNGGRDRR
jgi:ferric-dicitrate binding protein FerR (iron transport regulator)